LVPISSLPFILIAAPGRLEVVEEEYKVIENMKGKDLEGLKYEPLFNIKETQNDKSG